jgi:opacity protein-like surface antigen
VKIRTVTLVVSLIALPIAAQAQGLYLGLGAGFNKMQQEDVDAKLIMGGVTTDVPGEVLTGIGPTLSGAIGVGLRSGIRLEVEGNYLSNHIKGESGLSGEDLGTGTERKYGVMGNVLYEFTGSRVKPYFGGGAGLQFVHEPAAVSSSGGVTVSVNEGTQNSFAYQFIAGAGFHISGGLSFTADYRFMSLVGTRTYTGTATIPGVGSFDLTDSSTGDKNHSVVFGLRFGFGR